MRGAHIQARAARFTARTPAAARELASVSSPPMSVLLRLMDVPSDDFFAEMLTKQLGERYGTGGSTSAGANVISETLTSYGVQPHIVDGSGLSRRDRTSPEQVVSLLRAVWETPIGRELHDALPVVGVSGTVQGIGARTAAQGRCSAKTGTLDNVTNLAGYCHTLGGHELAFALFADGPSNGAAIPPLGRAVADIASY
jgi:serine-type D-Ala-D-Ala carboxypeptidase/endopeptidase (penicillin-binding protein 4)